MLWQRALHKYVHICIYIHLWKALFQRTIYELGIDIPSHLFWLDTYPVSEKSSSYIYTYINICIFTNVDWYGPFSLICSQRWHQSIPPVCPLYHSACCQIIQPSVVHKERTDQWPFVTSFVRLIGWQTKRAEKPAKYTISTLGKCHKM